MQRNPPLDSRNWDVVIHSTGESTEGTFLKSSADRIWVYRSPLVRNITSQGPPMFALSQLNEKVSLSVSLLPLLDLINDSSLITEFSSASTLIFTL